MDVITCIKERRSIRAFADTPVSKETLARLIDTAAQVPSWKNAQPTRYTAAVKRETLDRIAATLPDYNARIVSSAPALIAVSAMKKRSGYERDGSPSTIFGDGYEFFDCGVATQTLCLAAWEQGLGTVIMGIFDVAAAKEIFSVPEEEDLIALVAIGVPKAPVNPVPKKDHASLLRYID